MSKKAFEETKKTVLSFKKFEDIADLEFLELILDNTVLDKAEQDYLLGILIEKAKEMKMSTQFQKILTILKAKKLDKDSKLDYNNYNRIDFRDAPFALLSKKFKVSTGDCVVNLDNQIVVPQPILISQIFVDAQNNFESVEISYKKNWGNKWIKIVVPKSTVANNREIIALSNYGILVTSDTSKALSEYLSSLIVDNPKVIQHTIGSTHLGFIGEDDDDEEFIPYSDKYKIIGNHNYGNLLNSIKVTGSFVKWLEMYRNEVEKSIPAKIMTLASLGSVLTPKIDNLIFIYHLWGESDTGKTLCLDLASSVWGKFQDYKQNMNATGVGLERTANFLQHLPLVLNELQTVTDSDLSKFIYAITEGQGRMRGTVDGIQKNLTWQNVVLVSGEQPLTSYSSKGGEHSRVVEIYPESNLFEQPSEIYNTISNNYGWVGFLFVQALLGKDFYMPGFNFNFADKMLAFNIYEKYQIFKKYLNENNKSLNGKKNMCIAQLLLTDELFNYLFLDCDLERAHEKTLAFYQDICYNTDIIDDSKKKDIADNAYDYILGVVAQNPSKFMTGNYQQDNDMREVWGKFFEREKDNKSVFIFGNVLRKILDDGGFNYDATLNGLNKKGYTILSDGATKSTKLVKINNIVTRGVEIKL